jgi:membrane-associated protease RseP (regulator of RpoE activity)
LHAEKGKGHFIGKVDPNSIAERAGLEEGQRIVGVNNTLIYPDTIHKDVVTLIKKDANLTELLVVFPEIDNWYRGKEMEFSFDDAETVQFEVDSHHVHIPHVEQPVSNGKAVHVEHPKEEVTVVKVAPSPPHHVEAHPSSHQDVIHEEIKHVPVEPKRQSPPAPRPAPVPAHVQSNGAPDLFRLSAAEMRERLSSQKKADPRKEAGNLSLKQKYDIIQSL